VGRLAKVLDFFRTEKDGKQVPDVKADPGGGAPVLAAHLQPPGIDSCPLPGDTVSLEPSTGTGAEEASGYADTDTERKADLGEVRLYSRSSPGVAVAHVWCKKDGSIVIEGLLLAGGKIELDPATGTLDLNGLKIDTSGNLTTPGEVTAKDAAPATKVSLSTHLHPTAVGPTGAPTPGS
jgi:hypothetical protein